jgi:hypothetical protein
MTTLAADRAAGRRERVTVPLLAAGAVLAASVVLHLRDPHQSGSYLFCPWLVLTGTYCPGCGGLRAVNDLTHGDLAAAASSNLLLVAALPVALGMWTRWFLSRWRGVRRSGDQRLAVVLASLLGVVSLVFWVVRNLPGMEWLLP